jgi:hypothetical protein
MPCLVKGASINLLIYPVTKVSVKTELSTTFATDSQWRIAINCAYYSSSAVAWGT